MQAKVVTRPPWLAKNGIYTFAQKKKKKLYVKLTYCDHPNKNVEHPNLKITKFGFNKNKSNITLTTFLQ